MFNDQGNNDLTQSQLIEMLEDKLKTVIIINMFYFPVKQKLCASGILDV